MTHSRRRGINQYRFVALCGVRARVADGMARGESECGNCNRIIRLRRRMMAELLRNGPTDVYRPRVTRQMERSTPTLDLFEATQPADEDKRK